MRIAVLVVAGLIYWQSACLILGVGEPWDAPAYWPIAYPGSLLLSAALGWGFRTRGWQAGAIVTAAQLPIIMISAGLSPLLPVGLLFLTGMSVPAMIAGELGGRLRAR